LPEYVSLNVYDASYHLWDNTMIRFSDNAGDADDNNEDALKASNPDMNCYSLSSDDHKLAIDVRPYSKGKVIPLGIATSYANDYIIRAENAAVPAGSKLYLHDKLLGKYMQLQQGTEYRFTISADKKTQGEGRFELSMDPAVAEAIKGLSVSITPNPASDDVQISVVSDKKDNISVNISDMNGVSVYTREAGVLASNTITIPLSTFAPGIYLVEISNGKDKVVQRLIKE
jgi:hypothetical protein